MVVNFCKVVVPPWDPQNPTYLPIPPIKRGSHTHIPLKMAWVLTIHKSQGMTLPKSTIYTNLFEHQSITFTTISTIPSLICKTFTSHQRFHSTNSKE